MGGEETNVGTVTQRSLSEIVEKLREDAYEMTSPFFTKTPDEPGWAYMAKAFIQIADEIEATGAASPTVCECGKDAVRGGKCEEHKVDRRKGNWNGDRRRPGSTDTPPSCGNGACHSEIYNGETVTRHHLHCPDRGPGWA